MSTDSSFEAGAPMGFDTPMQPTPQTNTTPANQPAPKRLVDVYTAMLFVAAIFLLVGSLALAWEKQRYGELFGNSWKIPPDIKVSAIEKSGDFDTNRFFRA